MAIAEISALLTSLKAATEISKLIKESKNSLEDAEINYKFSELLTALADANTKIVDVQRLIIEKEDEIQSLKTKFDIKEKMKWESPYYWKIEGDQKEGPYCQQCYDNKSELIRLQDYGTGEWECKTCKNFFKDSNYKSPTAKSFSSKRKFDDFIK